MDATPKKAKDLKLAIGHWQSQGLISSDLANKLEQNIVITPFDWKKLAKYSFWFAVASLLIAISAAVADEALRQLFQIIFDAPHWQKTLGLSLLASAFYVFGLRRRRLFPNKFFSNESILLLGILSTASAVYQLGMSVDTGSGHFSILLLISFCIYGAIGYFCKSKLTWIFAILSLGGWLGAETGYQSGWGAYYLGMNYPLRFVFFGIILTGLTFLNSRKRLLVEFGNTNLAMGLLYLFISLWIMSIFGNYGDYSSWELIQQSELFYWAILFGIVSGLAIYHGIKYENSITKGFGITFLFINLYTRYFEYFWNDLHKALFFAVLAISFWLVGIYAEKIWILGKQTSKILE